MVLLVVYAVLSRIRLWRNLRVFGANFLGPNLYLCYLNCFFHLWSPCLTNDLICLCIYKKSKISCCIDRQPILHMTNKVKNKAAWLLPIRNVIGKFLKGCFCLAFFFRCKETLKAPSMFPWWTWSVIRRCTIQAVYALHTMQYAVYALPEHYTKKNSFESVITRVIIGIIFALSLTNKTSAWYVWHLRHTLVPLEHVISLLIELRSTDDAPSILPTDFLFHFLSQRTFYGT